MAAMNNDAADVRPGWVAPPTQGWKGLHAVTTGSADRATPGPPRSHPGPEDGMSVFVLIVFGQGRSYITSRS